LEVEGEQREPQSLVVQEVEGEDLLMETLQLVQVHKEILEGVLVMVIMGVALVLLHLEEEEQEGQLLIMMGKEAQVKTIVLHLGLFMEKLVSLQAAALLLVIRRLMVALVVVVTAVNLTV
jgi:vacuolar-type H+-ATPase subunit D/Vma8